MELDFEEARYQMSRAIDWYETETEIWIQGIHQSKRHLRRRDWNETQELLAQDRYELNLSYFSHYKKFSWIERCAFAGNEHITSVRLSRDLNRISAMAFANCTALKHIIFEGGSRSQSRLDSIGERAFYACVSLECVLLPITCCSIGKEAFAGCSSLRDVSVFSNTSIGAGAFADCPNVVIHVLDSGFAKLFTIKPGQDLDHTGSVPHISYAHVFDRCAK